MSGFESPSRDSGRSLPAPLLSTRVEDLLRMAEASKHGLIPEFSSSEGVRFVEPTAERRAQLRRLGSQEVLSLSDDVMLVTTDLRGFPHVRNEHDLRGWLYLHFRLDGVSNEELPGCTARRIDRECFLLSATSQPLVREPLADTWRTVGIACHPTFVQQDLRWLGEGIPEELRRFRAGDAVEFSFVGTLTSDMRAAAQSLLHTSMPPEIRNMYLRAKVVELVCLALARIRAEAELRPDLQVRLSRRDVECVQQARNLILANSSAPSLGSLARQVGINRNKLAVGFKHIFGVTVGEFDRQMRLAHARTLLERDGLSVGHVANLAGYADPGSFSKAFKFAYGVLPSEICAATLDGKK
jgi:AraC-like DNA-binding protein